MYSTDTCRFYSGGSAAGTAPSNSTCPKQDLVNVPIGGDIWGPGDIAQLRDPSGAIISSCTFNPLADVTIHDATCN